MEEEVVVVEEVEVAGEEAEEEVEVDKVVMATTSPKDRSRRGTGLGPGKPPRVMPT